MPSNQSYQVAEHRVDALFAPDSVAFQIPMFQRRYAWGTEEVSDLLADLYGEYDWLDDRSVNQPYFLGSIVLAKGNGPDIVLDGQQRLTTISLLLAVLKEKLMLFGSSGAHDIQKYLQAGKLGEPKSPKIRLQPEDAEAYATLINEPSKSTSPEIKKTLLAHAVRKITERVNEYLKWAQERGTSEPDAVENMAKRVLYGVEFVGITAPSEAEAFKLFETLNDRGLPLNAADLFKNKLFAQCGERYLEEARQIWGDVTEIVGEAEVISFLRSYWIAFYDSVRKDRLYNAVRDELNKLRPVEALEFAESLKSAAQIYQHIANPDPKTCPWGSETGERLYRLLIFRARTARPVILACAKSETSFVPELVAACEVATVRYSMVAELNPNQLERAYNKLCQSLRKSPGDFKTEVYSVLKPLIPSDEEFENKFAFVEISGHTPPWREIYVRLNQLISTGETAILGPSRVHLEHILPLNPSREALIEAQLTSEEAKDLVNSIGNITLLSGRKNQAISNKPFSFKQPVFASSEIALNRSISMQSRWGRKEIEDRALELAKLAVKAWGWPGNH
jgi:hypothetical protein